MEIPKLNSERLLSTFLDLVKIDSPSLSEKLVADYLTEALKPLDCKVWMDDAAEKIKGNCGNLHVRVPGRNSSAPSVLFSAHMDTVMPGIGVKPEIRDGVIYSDGTTVLGADDKAGVAAIMEMLRQLHEINTPHGPIEIIFDVAEEIGLLGAKHVDMKTVDAKFAIVLDAEEMDRIVCKSPSANRMVYEIEGIAAHAGMAPEKGISAIEVFAHAVANMQLGRIDPDTTANIGKVIAGSATNIVTPHLEAHGEARSHSEDTLKLQTESMSEAFRVAVKQYTRTIEGSEAAPVFHEKIAREFSAMNISHDSSVFRLASDSGKALGIDMQPVAIGGGTNASVYNEQGLSSVIIGCGMQKEHTTDEHVSIQDMEIATRLCLGIVRLNHEQSGT